MRSCGNIAEADASREITQEHLDKAVDSLVSVNVSRALSTLNENELNLLNMIIDYEGPCSAKDLSEIYKEKTGSSYASFNRLIDKLEFVRLIDTNFTGKGVKKNSREIILRFNPEDFDL